MLIVMMNFFGWAQCVSGGSIGLGMEVGQSLCLWLVTVVDSWEGGQVSKVHWEMVTRMVGRVACGLVSSGKSLTSFLRSAVREAGQMANARAQAGLEEKSGIVGDVDKKSLHLCWWLARLVVTRKNEGQVGQQQVHPIELRRLGEV